MSTVPTGEASACEGLSRCQRGRYKVMGQYTFIFSDGQQWSVRQMKCWFHDPQLTMIETLEQEPEPVPPIAQVPQRWPVGETMNNYSHCAGRLNDSWQEACPLRVVTYKPLGQTKWKENCCVLSLSCVYITLCHHAHSSVICVCLICRFVSCLQLLKAASILEVSEPFCCPFSIMLTGRLWINQFTAQENTPIYQENPLC